MTTEIAIAEARALVAELAAMTVACGTCTGWEVNGSCPDCHGTGTLPRFPSARRKCEGCVEPARPNAEAYHADCHGSGEVPDYDVPIEALEADLTVWQAEGATQRYREWLRDLAHTGPGWGFPMPSEAVNRAAKLKAIVEVVT